MENTNNTQQTAPIQSNNRLGFRVLGYFILVYLAVWLLNILLGVGPNFIMRQFGVSENVHTFIGSTITYMLRLLGTIGISAWGLKRVLDINPWQTMFPTQKGWWRDLLFGFFLTSAVMVLLFMFQIALGWFTVDSWNWQMIPTNNYLRNLWLAILVNFYVAVGEETLFRGYLLTGLEQAWGRWLGLGIMAIVFSAFHLSVASAEETMTLLFVILLSFPGIVLGWSYLQTRALWLPIGIHFAWNFMQDDILNLPGRSGEKILGAIGQQSGPSWIVGTSYGIEVGLLGIVGMVLLCFGIWAWLKVRGAKPTV